MATLFCDLQTKGKVILILAVIIVEVLMYHVSLPYKKISHPAPARPKTNSTHVIQNTDKPVLLLWFWPENKRFDLQDCKTLFQIDTCHLTDDRSLYSRAQGVLVFHNAIQDDLSNLPTSPRPSFQRWIWFNTASPNNTRRIKGTQGLFNLTMSYRRDADIHVHWRLTLKKDTDEDFVLPRKERLLCLILDRGDPHTQAWKSYYEELTKHIKVDVFYSLSASFSKSKNYFQTVSSCKFYLSFESSTHRDDITESFNGPLAAGTVPIVLGPPRRNYEDLAPGSSFIHVNDFPHATKLVEFLLRLDKDHKAYMRYFDWRRFYTARRHPTEENRKFSHAICQACYHVGVNRVYRVVPDLYKWFFI
ncbi:4-galactosyl-N-acetylglucosaminide 3-alpha-L-fucosyltransferase 9-like [Trematomus bernacchii]|uniref:4-galactosyl-N-acetylglucosaminide 3-alpha-L-fucosyltransferase 9-like n=1 Tax=Trematomus bernacchii TaxID=40690 RepID=UPI00146DA993|nr:4-galactosyl-N-acetylglucosaminide 3-alpha-L-fucosyltransferase 9-like [Trematomus bernacchii]